MIRLFKMTLSFLLTLVLLISPSIVKGDIANKEVIVDISATFDGTNKSVTFFTGTHNFNSELRVTEEVPSNHKFAFWIVDGFVREELPENNTFLANNDLTALAVYHEEEQRAVVFIDYNGKLIDIQYVDIASEVTTPTVLPNKPNYITDGFISIKGSSNIKNITENTVFKLQYTKNTEDFYSILVEGGTVSNEVPDYNEVVTVTPTISNFSHWEENGNIISYNESYSFSALYNRELIAVSNSISEATSFIIMSHDLANRTGYVSHVAQISLLPGDELLEYGYLVSEDPGELTPDNATRIKCSAIHHSTNEFLTSISILYTNIRAYAIICSGENIIEIYSEYIFVETFETVVLDSSNFSNIIHPGSYGINWHIMQGKIDKHYMIDDKGVTLSGENGAKDIDQISSITATFTKGIKSFQFDYRKAQTSALGRTYLIDVTSSLGTKTYIIPPFGEKGGVDETIHRFIYEGIELEGIVTIRIYATGNDKKKQATFGDFQWTENNS